MEMKYQVVRNTSGGQSAILFDKQIVHKSVRYIDGRNWEILGAGFCSVKVIDGKLHVEVWGKSETLEVASRKEDAAVIARLFA